jgi:hypothetical protein
MSDPYGRSEKGYAMENFATFFAKKVAPKNSTEIASHWVNFLRAYTSLEHCQQADLTCWQRHDWD